MNYCGATGNSRTGVCRHRRVFPFFSALLGWMGVFLTGSDTSANALFGNLQVVTANKLGLNPVLMAASNSAGGVMGKMISLEHRGGRGRHQHEREDEIAAVPLHAETQRVAGIVIGLIALFYTYVAPGLQP